MARPKRQQRCPKADQTSPSGGRLVIDLTDRPFVKIQRRQILLVGGIGGKESQYRSVVAEWGATLLYCERKLPRGTTSPELAGVVVITNPCSHPLREGAVVLAETQKVGVVYIGTPSTSALKRALEELFGPPPPGGSSGK